MLLCVESFHKCLTPLCYKHHRILCGFVKFAINDRRVNCCSARTFNNITCAKCKTLPTHLCRGILCAWRIFENHFARASYKNGKSWGSWGFLSSSRNGWNYLVWINIKFHLHYDYDQNHPNLSHCTCRSPNLKFRCHLIIKSNFFGIGETVNNSGGQFTTGRSLL